MLLSSLIASNDDVTLYGKDIDVSGLSEDSRKVKSGDLFIATPGTKIDGSSFIADALAKGAVAVLVPKDVTPPPGTPTLSAVDVRAATSALAATFYARQPDTIVAVTGTSGKTSTAQFAREIWQQMGFTSGSIGTLGLVTAQGTFYGSLTTPDAITLHRLLDESAQSGLTHMAIEASSHGIELKRIDHVHLKAAAFTNLSRDHLDYHQTMEAYLAAKLRLFTTVLPQAATAVVNADFAESALVIDAVKKRGLKLLTYGASGKDLRLIAAKPTAVGQLVHVEIMGRTHEFLLPVMGDFQAWNALCAVGLAVGSGSDADKAVAALAKLSGVPGRLQLIGLTPHGGAVFVDYAHKPDALDNVLRAMRPHVAAHKGAKLGVIFGCGGNRDKGKRPIMGRIAAEKADWVIVTDDNPRHEEPAVIRAEILAGCGTVAHVREVGDRAKAIEQGIAQLNAHDVLIIAGKGHEPGQTVGDNVYPFDDSEEARKVLGI